jgi:uncharacterized membrane protein
MQAMRKKVTDADLEKIIGQLLRYGVLISSLVVLAGGIVYLIRHGRQLPEYGKFTGEPDKMREPVPMWKAIIHGEGRPLIQLGLLVLIATPIARILFHFWLPVEKDYLYMLITGIVLAGHPLEFLSGAATARLFLAFLELGIFLFRVLLVKRFELCGCLFVHFFYEFVDGIVLVFEEVFRLRQVASQQHCLFV